MKQYWEVKNQYSDAILFFRLGDFYEMFHEDAQIASKILDIALTSRDKKASNPVPLCGVPHHSAQGYISQLLDHGYKVALCEQVQDPKDAKGIVERRVVRVITPALRSDAEGLSPQETSLLLSIRSGREGLWGMAWLDAAGGNLYFAQDLSGQEMEDHLWKLMPKEILISDDEDAPILLNTIKVFQSTFSKTLFQRLEREVLRNTERSLKQRFQAESLESFGFSPGSSALDATQILLYYVENKNQNPLSHLSSPSLFLSQDYLHLDHVTQRTLELYRSARDPSKDRTLFGVLDETASSMGGRLLREWIVKPLRDPKKIEARLDLVEELVEEGETRERTREALSRTYDLERLIGRMNANRANARDLVSLSSTLFMAQKILDSLKTLSSDEGVKLINALNPHLGLAEEIGRAFVDEPPLSIRDGEMIRPGYNPQLDELRKIQTEGRTWIALLVEKERERTKIPSLKVGYNRVFGYFIEVTKTHLSKVPSDYIRKQTLASQERYVTPELKDMESKILGAEEKIHALEYEIFESLKRKIIERTQSLKSLAHILSQIDVFCALARVAVKNRYKRPHVDESGEIEIKGGRHPVVERFMNGEPFVPNDVHLSHDRLRLMILTGPNMAGKSTVMRQTALITLMAHMGSFVPAESAKIGWIDRIFTRVGASDEITKGQSTFMVEMSETANILQNATSRSLVLLDEIGRGTSTFDGLAIAWAVAEELHDRNQSRTIFATHYHELTDLARTKDHVFLMNLSVKEWENRIVFLRTLRPGAVQRSFGIEVARLAGIHLDVIDRAKVLLSNLEEGELDAMGKPSITKTDPKHQNEAQLTLFRRQSDELFEEFQKLHLDDLSPKECFLWLDRMKSRFS